MDDASKKNLGYRIAASSFFFMQGIVFSTWTTHIADIRTELGLSEVDLGKILFGLPLGQFLTMPVSGYLTARFSSKRCIFAGALLYPLCLLLINAAGSMWKLFACLLCFGVCANLTNIAINTQAVSVEKLYGRSIMGAFHGTWSFACFCGGLISMALLHLGIPMSAHFGITICMAIVNLAVFGRLLYPFDAERTPKAGDEGKTRTMFTPTPFILMLGATAFGSMSCEGTMFDWSVVYFRDVVRVADENSTMGYIAFMSMMATGRFAADFFINKFGSIRVLQFSGAIITTGMMLAVLFPNVYAATTGFFMVGIGVSSVVPICYSAAGKSQRMPAGIAIATVSSIGFLGFLLGPPLIGFIAGALNLRFSFATMALIGLLVSIIAPFMRFRLGKN